MSNFQAVQQAGGANVIMLGQIVEFKGEGVGKRSGKPWKKVVVEDEVRERHTVTVRGNLPPIDALNKQAQFTLSTYDGVTYQGQPYVGYSGFCDVLPNYGPQPPAPPVRQPAPQAQYPRQQQQSPAPPLSAQAPPRQQTPAPRDYDKENRGKCRFGFYQALLQAGFNAVELNENMQQLQAVEGLVEKAMEGINQPPKQTLKNVVKDAQAFADERQARINAEQAASFDQGQASGDVDVPY